MSYFETDTHRRKSNRLPGYDYSRNGAYFVTICTQRRLCLFGNIVEGEMVRNEIGEVVQEEWLRSVEIRSEIELDCFVVMPNHLHGIIWILDSFCRGDRRSPKTIGGPQRNSLGAFIAGLKSSVTRRVNDEIGTPENRIWQRNYHEHVIRNDNELTRIREYIVLNPTQ